MKVDPQFRRFRRGGIRLRFAFALCTVIGASVVTSINQRQAQSARFVPSQIKNERAVTLNHSEFNSGVATSVGGNPVSSDIALKSGEYLHVTVEQNGVNVSMMLVDPHGRILLRVDNNSDMYGSERLSWIVKQSGLYNLRVSAVDKHSVSGSYEIKIDERRQSTSGDQVRLVAEQQLSAANRYYKARQLGRALDSLRTAGQLWGDVQDRLEQLSAFNKIGDLYLELGDLKNAIEYGKRAIDLNKSVNSQFEEAISLTNLGDAYFDLGHANVALGYYQQALALRRMTGDVQGEGITIGNIGTVNHYLGNVQVAYDCFQQALSISRSLHDRHEEARTLLNLGMVYESLNENQRALELWNLALGYYRELDDPRMELYGLLKVGMLYRSLGDTRKTVEILEQVVKKSRKLSDHQRQSRSLCDLGDIYAQAGKAAVALRYYDQALKLSKKVDDRRSEAQVLYALSLVHKSSGQYKPAVSKLNEALALSRSQGDRKAQANMLYVLAQIKRLQGNLSDSLKDIEAALQISESLSYKIDDQSLRASYFDSIRERYEFYIDVLMQLNDLYPEDGFAAKALEVSERSRARNLSDLLMDAAISAPGVESHLVERERSLRQLLSATTAYQMSMLRTKLEQNDAEEIAKDIDHLTMEYLQVRNRIRQENPNYEMLGQPPPANLAEIQLALQGSDTLMVEYALGTERSYLWAVSSNSVVAYELPPRATIEKIARNVYELVSARQNSPQTKAAISEADALYHIKASALSEMLLGPVAEQLGTKRLLIVGDGLLHYIPFAALPAPSLSQVGDFRPLIVDHEIVDLPSASVLLSLQRRNANRQRPTKAVAIVADPVFETDDPRVRVGSVDDGFSHNQVEGQSKNKAGGEVPTLKQPVSLDAKPLTFQRLSATREEAAEILTKFPANQTLVADGFQANRELVMRSLSSYSIVHFATHGLIDDAHPELSGLVLSMVNERGQPENGFLQLHDIYNLKLSADLVVLSACDTGLGKNSKSEGLVGLTQGFMYSGAQSVIASLWRVDDNATADLMNQFYAGMRDDGLKPAAALRKAQIEMWQQKRWNAPYYWAAFTLQGDWNTEVAVPRGTRYGTLVLYALILLPFGVTSTVVCFHGLNRMRMRTGQ